MATLGEGLYHKLTTTAAITALVSERVYALVAPETTDLPCIVWQQISGPRYYSHDGASGLARARVQLTFIGKSLNQAKQVSEAVRAAIEATANHTTWGPTGQTVTIGSVFLDNEIDQWASTFAHPVVRHDYIILYYE